MSYFICGFKSDTAACKEFDNVFADLIPNHVKNDAFRIESRTSWLTVWGNKKAIPNIVIKDDKQGSWLAVIGTPLVHLQSKQGEIVFLSDFLTNGVECLREKIDGNFAIVAYDAQKEKLIAATDFNTTTPIFYTITPNGVYFASHELALAKFMKAEVDAFGFSQTIHIGITWGSSTRFQKIYKMLPCQIAIVDHNTELHTESYWNPQEEKIWNGTFEDQLQMWMSLLSKSVRRYYECSDHKPVITDFTAGEDSRLILAQCHALGIPFKAHVTGLTNDIDVIVAKEAAKKVEFELIERQKQWISKEDLLKEASNICLNSDGYQEIFAACTEFATNSVTPLNDYNTVLYCGVPGGEAFRGSYYLRGKALFPAKRYSLDYKFITRMKFLLDYHPGLLKYSDDDFLGSTYEIVKASLEDVKELPVGTQIDHVLRVFQTCFMGLKYKSPLYLPFSTNQMTRSIYNLSPQYKNGGGITKASTEILYPELAFIKTQNGVPTVRKTISRMHLFIPEYVAVLKKISSGAISRYLKWTQANKWYYSQNINSYIYKTLLNTQPYSNWFSSSNNMVTGHLYNPAIVNAILEKAKTGECKWIPILGRIINQELALRWVYNDKLS